MDMDRRLGDTYMGACRDGKNCGHGTETWADGKTHTGAYRDDKRHRRGAITWADGCRHKGAWRESAIHGQGTFTSPPYTKLSKHGRLARWQSRIYPLAQVFVRSRTPGLADRYVGA